MSAPASVICHTWDYPKLNTPSQWHWIVIWYPFCFVLHFCFHYTASWSFTFSCTLRDLSPYSLASLGSFWSSIPLCCFLDYYFSPSAYLVQAAQYYLTHGICVYSGTIGDGAFFCVVSICTLREYAPCGFWSRSFLFFIFSSAGPFEPLGTDLVFLEVGCCRMVNVDYVFEFDGRRLLSWFLGSRIFVVHTLAYGALCPVLLVAADSWWMSFLVMMSMQWCWGDLWWSGAPTRGSYSKRLPCAAEVFQHCWTNQVSGSTLHRRSLKACNQC